MTLTEFRRQLEAAKAYRLQAPKHWPAGMATAREDDLLTAVLGFFAEVLEDPDVWEMADSLHQMMVAREEAAQQMEDPQ